MTHEKVFPGFRIHLSLSGLPESEVNLIINFFRSNYNVDVIRVNRRGGVV